MFFSLFLNFISALCQSGFPSPEIKWFKDGVQLRPSKAFNFINQPEGVIGLR